MTLRKKLLQNKRLEVYNKYKGHCAYCGCELDIKDMQVDHIIAVHKSGGNEINNLMPACRMCNFYKSTYSLEDFRTELGKLTERLDARQFTYRIAKKYSLIQETGEKIQFYFEKQEAKQ